MVKTSSYREYPWSLFLSTTVAIIVLFLKFKQGYLLEDILIIVVGVFIAIYVLIEANLFLLDKFQIWDIFELKETEPSRTPLTLVKSTTKETTNENFEEKNQSKEVSGQVDPSLSLGLPDEQAQSEIRQRLGLN